MKNMLKTGVIVIVMSLAGCQLIGGASAEEQIAEMLASFEELMEAQDIDGALELYSYSFSSTQGLNKQTLRDFMQGAKDQGALEGLEVSTENTEIVVNDDGTATAGPVQISSSSFSISQNLTLVNEDGTWLFSGAQ
jgi:hypothetical protein